MKTSTWVITIGVIAVLVLLFAWPKFNSPYKADIDRITKSGLDCSPMEGTAQHFHPVLRIFVDGVEETIPANIGIFPGCMSEIHTHDMVGTIHVESPSLKKAFYIKDFFVVRGAPIERDGYTVGMTVDGQPNIEMGNLLLRDKQQIELIYTHK